MDWLDDLLDQDGRTLKGGMKGMPNGTVCPIDCLRSEKIIKGDDIKEQLLKQMSFNDER